MKNYVVLSPDGFTINLESYENIDDAKLACEKWAKRYEAQGYYSSNQGRIPYEEIIYHCTFKQI
jgi:hypothetical protein